MGEMNDERVFAWVTKYALTDGIKVVDATVHHSINSKMISWKEGEYSNNAHGKDWHRTPEEAVLRAEEMRKAKIESLKKSIKKMESLKFLIKDDPRK